MEEIGKDAFRYPDIEQIAAVVRNLPDLQRKRAAIFAFGAKSEAIMGCKKLCANEADYRKLAQMVMSRADGSDVDYNKLGY